MFKSPNLLRPLVSHILRHEFIIPLESSGLLYIVVQLLLISDLKGYKIPVSVKHYFRYQTDHPVQFDHSAHTRRLFSFETIFCSFLFWHRVTVLLDDIHTIRAII